MLQAMGAQLRVEGRKVSLVPGELAARDVRVPGDISSAAFLICAAAMLPGSHLRLVETGVNPTRLGIVDALLAMGAQVSMEASTEASIDGCRMVGAEPVADVTVTYSELKGASFGGEQIVRMIDEVPLLALAATQARGVTQIRDAGELRHKETDRIRGTVDQLRKLGADIEELPDGITVRGPTRLKGDRVDSMGDHRLAMTLTVAGLLADGDTEVQRSACISDSFPGFGQVLRDLGADVDEGR
jgi:3-phosphoshikimate 1-carboxyvinyltransferase